MSSYSDVSLIYISKSSYLSKMYVGETAVLSILEYGFRLPSYTKEQVRSKEMSDIYRHKHII